MILFARCFALLPFRWTVILAKAPSFTLRTRVNFERKSRWSLDFAAVAHIDRVFSPRVASGSGHRVTVTIDVGKECLYSDESG